MAKFRKARRYARKAFRKSRSYAKSSSLGPFEVALGSAAYGAVRPYASNLIPDVPQLGQYSDNIVLGGLGALAAWKGKGIVKKAGMIVLANESFIATNKAMSGTSTQATSQSQAW